MFLYAANENGEPKNASILTIDQCDGLHGSPEPRIYRLGPNRVRCGETAAHSSCKVSADAIGISHDALERMPSWIHCGILSYLQIKIAVSLHHSHSHTR